MWEIEVGEMGGSEGEYQSQSTFTVLASTMNHQVYVFIIFLFSILSTYGFVLNPRIYPLRGKSLQQPSLDHMQVSQPYKISNFGARLLQTRQKPLRDILGLGPAEIALTLVVALVLFGPETLKSLSKDVGRAAAELKEIPKTFKEGMDEGAESAQVAKMKAIAAEKRKKREEKLKKAEGETGGDDEEGASEEEEAK
jgi:Sec-independent protein translocase protein TatA